MNLRPAVLDALRAGMAPAAVAEHFEITEAVLLQIVANEMSARMPEHLLEYIRLQEMEKLWAEKSCKVAMPSTEAYSLLKARREYFALAMEKAIRQASGLNDHGEVRWVCEAFQKALDVNEKSEASFERKKPKTRKATK